MFRRLSCSMQIERERDRGEREIEYIYSDNCTKITYL